jgi:hypothetical protein
VHALGCDNVASLAIGILEKRNVSGPIRIVFQALYYGRDTILAALPIDRSIMLLVTTATMTRRDTPSVITTARLFLRTD